MQVSSLSSLTWQNSSLLRLVCALSFYSCVGNISDARPDGVVPSHPKIDPGDDGGVIADPAILKLYNTNCQRCHGDVDISAVRGASFAQITTAITEIEGMAGLDFLTEYEIIGLVALLRKKMQLPTSCEQVQPSFVNINQLNKNEYNNTLRHVLHLSAEIDASVNFPDDSFSGAFNNQAEQSFVSAEHLGAMIEVTDFYVSAALADSASRAKLIPCAVKDLDCRNQSLRRFIRRAYRRPIENAEYSEITERITQANITDAEDFMRFGMQLALLSTHFVYRIELDPEVGGMRDLNGHELATRLSYFLWQTMPDDELFALAQAGTLSDPKVLDQQVTRMLADPKALSLVDQFYTKWLNIDGVLSKSLNRAIFPQFTNEIGRAMYQESTMSLAQLVSTDASLTSLLTGDSTYLNRALADYYELDSSNLKGEFEPYALGADDNRGGILTHGSILTMTSGEDQTSITNRGLWVLERILCSPLDLPPNFDPSSVEVNIDELATPLEIMTAHAASPQCASCHRSTDPIGVGLENFSAAGRWRDSWDITGIPAALDKAAWALVSVDSEELVGETAPGTNAFDGDPETIWVTKWKGGSAPQPHALVIDLGAPTHVVGFDYLPRQDDFNGRVKDYEIYISDDLTAWGEPAIASSFDYSGGLKQAKKVLFPSKVGRYIKFVTLSANAGGNLASAAEIGFLTAKSRTAAVAAEGILPSGESFSNAVELQALIAKDPRFAVCVARHLTQYALGRGLSDKDQCSIALSAGRALDNDLKQSDLVKEIVSSDIFRRRASDGAN